MINGEFQMIRYPEIHSKFAIKLFGEFDCHRRINFTEKNIEVRLFFTSNCYFYF